jgi:hypothetical protein
VVEVVTDNFIDTTSYLKEEFAPTQRVIDDSEERAVVRNQVYNSSSYLEANRDMMIEHNFDEVVVPKEYKCPSGAKFKARALHYAILNSRATRNDWVVHLDEETRFDEDTVKHTLHHCVEQAAEVDRGEKKYGDVGQGVIIYGSAIHFENYVTTLADSVRVGDDYGKFRLQYETKRPLIGT